jgi:hypothetical protein
MDQTPLAFSLESGDTLHLRGERFVPTRGTGGSKERTTVCLAVTADGRKLKPMVIFKGQPNGQIARNELPSNPNRDDLAMICQPNAYQDEANMFHWIDLVLVPHIQERAQGIPVVLFLDQFSAHHMPAIKRRLDELGVELHGIPGGCTWVVQPINVGVAKPFKGKCKDLWWNWMINPVEDDLFIERATRLEQSNWVKQAWDDISEDTIRSSWRKSGLSYFVEGVDN